MLLIWNPINHINQQSKSKVTANKTSFSRRQWLHKISTDRTFSVLTAGTMHTIQVLTPCTARRRWQIRWCTARRGRRGSQCRSTPWTTGDVSLDGTRRHESASNRTRLPDHAPGKSVSGSFLQTSSGSPSPSTIRVSVQWSSNLGFIHHLLIAR